MRERRLLFQHELSRTVRIPVETLVRVPVGRDRRPLQRNAGEQAAGPRVAQDLGPEM